MLPIKPQKCWPIWAHWLDPSTVMAPHKSPCCDMAADSLAAAINPQTYIQEMVLGRIYGVRRYASK